MMSNEERRIFAIVSELDEETNARVQALWQELDETCGLKAIKIFPIPHFSWHGAEFYDIGPVETVLDEITRRTAPLVVQAGGVGIFTGPSPVVYIPLVASPPLLRFHQDLWERIEPLAHHPNPLYAPFNWVPHISLALLDVTQENIACAVNLLAFRALEMTLQVNNLALVYQIGDQVGRQYRGFELKGESCQ